MIHPFKFIAYSQNMALLPSVLYKGEDRDSALASLIAFLTSHTPDLVGLSEIWTGTDQSNIQSQLANVLPHSVSGPHDSNRLGLKFSSGGLLLLSRHPIIAQSQLVYRRCAGDDCFANKGVLFARIQPQGSPCTLDVFLTHTQAASPPLVSREAATKALQSQLWQLGGFISTNRDARSSAIILGDLNVDAYARPDTYTFMISALGSPIDLAPAVSLDDVPNLSNHTHPSATSESDNEEISSFHQGRIPRDVNNISRFQGGAERLDYFMHLRGNQFFLRWPDARVRVLQYGDRRDISDHYGLEVRANGIVEITAVDAPITSVQVRLLRFICNQTTSGIGDDEVEFSLFVRTERGESSSQVSRRFDDVDDGSHHDMAMPFLVVGDPGSTIVLGVSGKEIDTIGSDDELGSSTFTIQRSELLSLRGSTTIRGFPTLNRAGGNYSIQVELRVD